MPLDNEFSGRLEAVDAVNDDALAGRLCAFPSQPAHGLAMTVQARAELAVEVLDRASALRRLPAELDDLAARALESNVFAEAPMFIAALEHIDVDAPLCIVCVRDAAGALHGVFPLVRAPLRVGVNVMVLRNWAHRYWTRCARRYRCAIRRWLNSGDRSRP